MPAFLSGVTIEKFRSIVHNKHKNMYRHSCGWEVQIINGTGNYYIEARTRNDERTDMIIDYLGHQYVIEMKIWRGNAYNERGEN